VHDGVNAMIAQRLFDQGPVLQLAHDQWVTDNGLRVT
jgi:hypothetical protein